MTFITNMSPEEEEAHAEQLMEEFRSADAAWLSLEGNRGPERDAASEKRQAAWKRHLEFKKARHEARVGPSPSSQAKPAAPGRNSSFTARKRFEYRYEMWAGSRGFLGPGSLGDIASFNALGADGWELVAMYDRIVLFKRELLD